MILVVCGWFIWQEVGERWEFDLSFSGKQLAVVGLVFVLSFLNWGLEVWRWKFSLDQIGKPTLAEAGRQVFSGLALNWIMPFTSGDLIARLVPNQDRKRTGLLIYYNRSVMLGLTVLFGIFGVYHFSVKAFESRILLLVGVLASLIVLAFLIKRFLDKENEMNISWLVKLSLISILRYAVFSVQFVLLIWIFNYELSLILNVAGVGWIFLFRSVIPSLFGNLGVREASALVFFEGHVDNASLILIPSLLIWMINTVLPSLLGLYYLTRFPVKIAE